MLACVENLNEVRVLSLGLCGKLKCQQQIHAFASVMEKLILDVREIQKPNEELESYFKIWMLANLDRVRRRNPY